ncbi:2-oxopent-4-enoate hydratase [Rhodococcus rhodochrous]|uniref:2-oxo-hept-4-ene-1,7-dioate hydratase n=1 Tax=Rhodococcus rhodochrous TaxID=1829 RepID=UPI0007512DB2|nr:2-oxo-hepta-3-ene-1,7-dioic acid hydratase [Rhodococcus rhodochrous]MDO1484620.1 2-oxo-hepta-3-ene-1,7-dioic acid hydratase [Rhodococcus rhodochrous]SNV27264.1 2-oxopent-4-enoate hydratase [Rhodococcus rhodochrous]
MISFDEQTCTELAQELHDAELRRDQVRHFSARFPHMTIEDGYAVSRAWARIKEAEGQRVIGHKIGLTSRAMQVSSQIDEPDFGTLFDEMLYESGGTISAERFIKPRVEVELAFLLRDPIEGPDVSISDVLNATDRVTPALEIIDARIEQFDRESGAPRKVFDTISDNAANAGIVLGGNPVKPDEVDLRRVGALFYLNGIVEESGLAGAVLDHPARGVAWLARRLHGHGQKLEAGQIVLAGSFTRPIPMTRGDVAHADYGSLGSISFQLV